jgi:hypothetical protein
MKCASLPFENYETRLPVLAEGYFGTVCLYSWQVYTRLSRLKYHPPAVELNCDGLGRKHETNMTTIRSRRLREIDCLEFIRPSQATIRKLSTCNVRSLRPIYLMTEYDAARILNDQALAPSEDYIHFIPYSSYCQ